jgi:xylose isomerase
MGKLQDRFATYGVERNFEQMVEACADIPRTSGIECVYPQQVKDPVKGKQILDNYGLKCAALNVNLKGEPKFLYGSITSPNPETRSEAVQYIKTGLDIAKGMDCKKLTVSFLNDGSDYPFELDFARGFMDAAAAIREAAEHAKKLNVLLSLEYKPSEPRVHGMMNNAGKMAYFIEKVGMDNVGVTLDTGHALQALEVLGDSAAFLGATKRLFHVHVNDNYRNRDWDMVPGTVNFFEFLEFLLTLKHVGYDDWYTADVFPARNEAKRIMTKTWEWMDYMLDIVDAIHADGKIYDMMNSGGCDKNGALRSGSRDVFEIMDYVRKFVK